MRPALLTVVLLASSAALHPPPAAAQRDARIEVALPAPAERGEAPPAIRTVNVLNDGSLRELLHSGFPAQLHYRIELWSAGGLFDNLKRHTEWDVIVRYDPLARRYSATRIEGDRVTSLGSYDQLSGVEQALERPFQPPFPPPGGHDRFYYIVGLDVQMLSVNDLDEVERWLRGELSPAVHGERNPGTAITRGAKTLVTRLLGGKERHYEARTRIFRP